MEICNVLDSAVIRLEDGIISVVFEKDTRLTLELAKQLVEARVELSENKDYPLFVDIRGVVDIDEATRKYLSGAEGTKYALAAAVLIDNPLSKFFGNLFIKVDKPNKPLKLFSSKSKAIKWLKQISREALFSKFL